MDDSVLYTGNDGLFDNEKPVEEVKELQDEQERLIRELTPQLQDIIAMLDREKETIVNYIAEKIDGYDGTDDQIRGELIGAARYRKYLDELKTHYTLTLNGMKK